MDDIQVIFPFGLYKAYRKRKNALSFFVNETFISSQLEIILEMLASYAWCFFQKDLSPLVKRLAPANNNTGAQIPYVTYCMSVYLMSL